jgi:hypothetical protein
MDVSYRKVEFTEEIVLLLHSYVQKQWPILLWQAHAKQNARHGIITEFVPAKKSIKLSFTDGLSDMDFKQTLYCKGEEKKIVFKTLSIANDHNSVKVTVPNDLRLQELRTNKRYEMFSNKNAFLTVTIPSHYDSKESSFVFKLHDISEDGCSILMHSSKLKFFKEGDVLKVTQIGSDIVYIPFSATIMHIAPVKGKGQSDVLLYKVGVNFEQALFFYNYYLTRHLD